MFSIQSVMKQDWFVLVGDNIQTKISENCTSVTMELLTSFHWGNLTWKNIHVSGKAGWFEIRSQQNVKCLCTCTQMYITTYTLYMSHNNNYYNIIIIMLYLLCLQVLSGSFAYEHVQIAIHEMQQYMQQEFLELYKIH